jgi:hypothetical protein
MTQRGENLGLPLEPRQAFAVARERIGQHLDGDGALQVPVGHAIHFHPARADLGRDFIRAEAGAACERHGRRATAVIIRGWRESRGWTARNAP